MAVYRSDQAQLTFGTEAAPGGYPEIAVTGSFGSGTVTKSGVNHSAGSTSIQLAAATGMTVGTHICIGATVSNQEQELRKIEHVLGTGTSTVIYLDAPTGFYHPAGTAVLPVGVGATVTDAEADKFITLIPGVYETVDVPDPDMTIEARYFLGTQSKRNFFAAYKGQQTYTGSVPGFILLNGRALRYPIGKVVTVPSAHLASNVAELSAAALKGDVYIAFDGTNAATISASAPHNILCIDDGSATKSEVRKVVSIPSSGIAKLDYPLQFAHDDNASISRVDTAGYYTHNIIETVDLDTVSWHLHMRDSGETPANDFDRRYYGGLIGGASLSADEGGMLSMSWDGVNFQGMVHNQKLGQSSGSGVEVPFYELMQSIDADNVVFPTTEPYYFSEGSVTIFGQEVARVRSFNLTIANNEEPRYYIQRRYGRQRGPTEIREQRREYSLALSLALPDTTAALTATTTRLFNELLWEGDYGAGSGTGMEGFNIILRFDRGTNDSIVITIPDTTAATGGNNQGAFIRTAPHAISGDNPLQVDADVLFRNLKIVVTDSVYYYP